MNRSFNTPATVAIFVALALLVIMSWTECPALLKSALFS